MSHKPTYHNLDNLDYFFDKDEKLHVSVPTKGMYLHCTFCDDPVIDILGILEYFKDDEIMKPLKRGVIICEDCGEKMRAK